MTAAYTCDELRVLARLAGAVLPACLDGGWSGDDQQVADVVAARCLLARGALTQHAGGVRLTDAAQRLIAPLTSPHAILEVDCATPDGLCRTVTVWDTAGRLRLAEREPDVWQLSTPTRPPQADIAEALDGLSAAAPTAIAFTLDTAAFDRAGRWHRSGHPAEAADQLAAAGVDGDAAAAWLSALGDWRAEGSFRLGERHGTDGFALAELSWLDARDGGLWQITPALDLGTVTVAGATADELRSAAANLLLGVAP
ncbi:hypothetical protein F4553_000741 [Allocatelliglobosispora scoriae]|uniref:ESX secretion-associated protein EspG n=1 Tax=Allocatelliglobosispora scoriae TaxID=643052 RepID=A0A841BKT1_9ACTN|nr:hypothetical protein [Allocatelliglobosispora scoriae]MBB5867362.1 hypothetical protein [Allocatelliglobosispora scoriae]